MSQRISRTMCFIEILFLLENITSIKVLLKKTNVLCLFQVFSKVGITNAWNKLNKLDISLFNSIQPNTAFSPFSLLTIKPFLFFKQAVKNHFYFHPSNLSPIFISPSIIFSYNFDESIELWNFSFLYIFPKLMCFPRVQISSPQTFSFIEFFPASCLELVGVPVFLYIKEFSWKCSTLNRKVLTGRVLQNERDFLGSHFS